MPLRHGLVEARQDLDVRRVESALPLVGHGQGDVAADQLRPVQHVAIGGRERPRPPAALGKDGGGTLEDRDSGPVRRSWIECEVVALDDCFHPVVEPAHHHRTHGAHLGRVEAGRLAP